VPVFLLRQLACQSGVWKGSSISFKNYISGECSPPLRQSKSCFIADTSWFCTLSGTGGTGQDEFGNVERHADGWYAVTKRGDWPAGISGAVLNEWKI
jgi:hypothetical protein